MRIFGIISFLVLVFTPATLFAQGSGTSGGGTSSSSASSTGVSDVQVENQSEQGGFVGSGRPTGFVGIDEIYSTSSSRRTTTARSNSRVTTMTRSRAATSTMQRRPGTMAGTSLMGSSNNQSIRSVTSLDAGMMVAPVQRPLPMIEAELTRIHGIQDSRVSFTPSPTGTTAVLTGTVASERERRVAQQYLLLEPGIHRVENRLEIR
ncbi:MAG: BON domain-containing protein [Planctomycetaceae bacterium]|nr:BON domain-containing protein [Planctomycetaceae bacterium]